MTHPGPEQGIGSTPVPTKKPPIYSLGCLDLRTLRTTVEYEDDELVLTVDDGDVSVTFVAGMAGKATTVLGAERLASGAREYAEAIRFQLRIP